MSTTTTNAEIVGRWRLCGCIEMPRAVLDKLDGYGAKGIAASAKLDDGEACLFCVVYYEHGYACQVAIVALGMADEVHVCSPTVIARVVDVARSRGFQVDEDPPA